MTSRIEIRGARVRLRPLRASEIDEEWQAMVGADPMVVPELPDESRFRARLRRSGRLVDGRLDLAIDLDGVLIGRIQTFVPPGRPLPPGTFDLGIGLRENARGQGLGREALTLSPAGCSSTQAPWSWKAPPIPRTPRCARSSSGPAGLSPGR